MSLAPKKCPFHSIAEIKMFDALDPEARANPYPYYDWLRDDPERVVYQLEDDTSFYVIHRFEDVKTVFTDAENFSSHVIPTHTSPFFVLMDGENHKRIRTVMVQVFSQKNMLRWQNQISERIQILTQELLNSKTGDLFTAWANPIPLGTLAVLFGLEHDKRSLEKLHQQAIAINRALFVTGGTGPRRSNTPRWSEKFSISWALLKNTSRILKLRKLIGRDGMKELMQMISITDSSLPTPRPNFDQIPSGITPMLDLMIQFAERLNEAKAAKSSGDLPIAVFTDKIATGEVTFLEMVMAGAFILFAGYETTTSLLSNCFIHLARNKEHFEELKKSPDKLENFVEESLRYYTPVGRFLRRAKKDVILSGKLIPKDSLVIILSGAANTDPEKFENGCQFDMNRENAHQHLSFGKGAHFCVGAPLARMQVTAAHKELLNSVSELQIDETQHLEMVTDRDNGIFRYEKIIFNVR